MHGATLVGNAVGARTPFFSPDSRQLGYWENGEIRCVAVTDGAPVVVGVIKPHLSVVLNWVDELKASSSAVYGAIGTFSVSSVNQF